jgi:hypothetical protein
MSRILFVAGICFLLATPCSANNSFFIPGDAFFYFEIDQSEWKAAAKAAERAEANK